MNPAASQIALRALTPKEFSAAIGGLLTADTIREKCRRGDIATVNGPRRPPYYIRPEAAMPYLCEWRRFLVSV